MKEFETSGFTFRIKTMNAIELLALQDQIEFDSYESSIQTYNTMLEHVEVKIKDQWLTVKQKENFYPVDIENNLQAIKDIITHVVNYLKEVFRKSNASNTETK